jgi:DNA-binding HxlR family transcriptional regulator
MKNYGQYCPVSRAAEVLAERWTPIVVRNLLNGATTFNGIAEGAPGIPRSLLVQRLRHLERAGVISIRPNQTGRGQRYELTDSGRDLTKVVDALGTWGARWLDLNHEHANPDFVLWAWCHDSLAWDRLPTERTVVRFEFPDQPPSRQRYWIIFEPSAAEVCDTDPGFGVDLVVTANALTLARWHLGHIDWSTALRSGDVHVTGPRTLARQLPTWNRRSRFASTQPRQVTSTISN